MANPIKVLRQLLKAYRDGRADLLLKPDEVARGLEAIGTLLNRGLPDGERLFQGPDAAAPVAELAAFYAGHGRQGRSGQDGGTGAAAGGKEGEDGTGGDTGAGAGDRLYREDITRLAGGLADVADRMAVAASLRRARREAGFSIRELSRFAGVDHSYISRVERGAVPRPSGAVMNRLAGALGLQGWPGGPAASASGPSAGQADDPDRPDLAELGLHRAPVRALLKVARELTDEHIELLLVQAKAMRGRGRKR